LEWRSSDGGLRLERKPVKADFRTRVCREAPLPDLLRRIREQAGRGLGESGLGYPEHLPGLRWRLKVLGDLAALPELKDPVLPVGQGEPPVQAVLREKWVPGRRAAQVEQAELAVLRG